MTTLTLVRHQFRYDLRSFLRNRQARIATLALPVIFLALFVGVFDNHSVREHGVDVGSDSWATSGSRRATSACRRSAAS